MFRGHTVDTGVIEVIEKQRKESGTKKKMKMTTEKRCTIAKLILMGLLLISLLYVNFSVWSASYTEGDLEYEVRQGVHLISSVDPSGAELHQTGNIVHKLFSSALFAGNLSIIILFTVIVAVLSCDVRIHVPRTLEALSVRLNN